MRLFLIFLFFISSHAYADNIPKMLVDKIAPVEYQQKIKLYATTKPEMAVDIIARTEGNIADILVKEGDFLKKGDLIATINPNDRVEELELAKARLKQMELAEKAAKALAKDGFKGEIGLAEAKAELAAAKAEVASAEKQMRYTQMTAPFDGIIEIIHADIGQLVGAGFGPGSDAVGYFVALDPIVAVGHAMEKELTYLQKGNPAILRDRLGKEYQGKISYISAVADSETRSYRIEAEFPNANLNIKSGITSNLYLPIKSQQVHIIPQSAISLSDEGVVGVKVVDAENIVHFKEIKIIDENSEGYIAEGLEGVQNVIILGHPFVSSGNKVEVSFKEEKK